MPRGSSLIIYFEVDDVSEAISRIIERGIQIDELPKKQSWLWTEAKLKDLDENQIIIYNAGENRKNPPWRIK